MVKVMQVLVAGLVAWSSSAFADPAVTIQARMFRRDTGTLEVDLLHGAKSAKLGNLDYGVMAREMLIDTVVTEGRPSQRLTVTVTQANTKVSQTWQLEGLMTTAHHPILVSPTFCGAPMTIAATIGGISETRSITFSCSD